MLDRWRWRLAARGGSIGLAAAALCLLALTEVVPAGWVLAAIPIGLAASLVLPDGHGMAGGSVGGGSREDGAPGAEALWQRMLDGCIGPALVLDRDGVVLGFNAAAVALLGLVAGRHLAELSRLPEPLGALERALGTGEPQAFEMRMAVPVERLLTGLASPLGPSSGAGQPAVLIALADLTEQDRLSRMRADFVANASHELRTPLASLKGFIETLQGAAKDDPAARARFLGIMQAQADRMARLIDDLLSLSRIEMREHVAPRGTVDLANVIDAAVDGLRSIAADAGIGMTWSRPAEPLPVTGDRDELAQVVSNLVQNAVKYGRRGGTVTVAAGRRDGRVAIDVTDDGIGIAPEHLPRLTERFYRVSAKDSRERGGTGLGLAIVKHIVNRHQGELKIVSTVGQGSTFSVLLPAAEARRGAA